MPDWIVERRRPRVFYGWVIVLAGYGVFALGGGLLFHAFGTYVKLLEEDLGWTRTELSVAFSMQRVESGILGPVQGWMVDRFGPRAVMLVGVTLFGLGFMAFSQVNSLLWFYVVFALMATGQSLGSMLSLSVALVNWFKRRRGLALGLVGTGMATGGIMQPLVVAGLEGLGWRTMAFVSGVLILAIGLPLTMLVRHRPGEHGLGPDGDPLPPEAALQAGPDGNGTGNGNGQAPAGEEEISFTAREAMRTRAFWLLSIGHAMGLMTVGAMLVHFVSHVTEELDISLGAAAQMSTLMTVLLVIGMVSAGWLGDRVSKRWIIIVALVMHMVAMLMIALGTSVLVVALAAALQGAAWGARGPLTQALRADYFGTGSFGMIMGFSSLIIMMGMTAGPLVASVLYDQTGSYTSAFLVLAAASAIGALCFLFATKPEPPRRPPVPLPPDLTRRDLPPVFIPPGELVFRP
ncbi:MAG: MFS transporter [Chloroflexi bacterium]|nr:MFS transporter [Chloroflexota bacterium]